MSTIRVGAALLLLAGVCGPAAGHGSSLQPVPTTASTAAHDRAIREQLGLSGFELVSLNVQPDPAIAERLHARFQIDHRSFDLTLDPHSMRAPGFALVAGDQVIEAPRIRTFRGSDMPSGDQVAATIIDGQMSAAIRGADEPLFVQPLSEIVTGADPTQHVVYTASQIIDGGWQCAGDHHCDGCSGTSASIVNRGETYDAACMQGVEVVFDADYPYFQARGSSTSSATTDIETVANQVDLIYRRDVGVAVTIKQITLRTSQASDPYDAQPLSSVIPNTLLTLVGNVWSSVNTPSRDLVHLMTGRDLQSSTIGIAWVGVVCRSNTNNTGVSQTLFSSNLAMRTILTAHEMGHNFGASHDSTGSYIMASGVSPSVSQTFSPGSISTITTFVSTYSTCLTASGPSATADSSTTRAPAPVLIDVLANDTAGCAGALAFTLPAATTSAGGRVAISTGTGPSGRDQVQYTPPATVPAAGITDTFSYRLTEIGSTATATGSASVTVQPASTPACTGDFNGSGAITVQDVFDFLAAYFGGSAQADINRSGGVSVQDVFDFLSAYFNGCP